MVCSFRAPNCLILTGSLLQQSSQSFRVEKDTFGDLQVLSDRYWGAQTQR